MVEGAAGATCEMSVVLPITGSYDLTCGGERDWAGALPKHLDFGDSAVVDASYTKLPTTGFRDDTAVASSGVYSTYECPQGREK